MSVARFIQCLVTGNEKFWVEFQWIHEQFQRTADALVPHDAGYAPDAAESIVECRAFTTELRQMVASGEIRDANTLAAFARLVAQGRV